MRRHFHLPCVLALATLLASPAFGQSQAEMNRAAQADFEKADAKLNAVYKKVLHAMGDEEERKQLIAAQRAWLAYRDTQAAFEADLEARGGSLRPLIFHGACTRLTEQRTKELAQAIAGK